MKIITKNGKEYLKYDEILMVFVKEDAEAVLEKIRAEYMPEHGEPVVTDLTEDEMYRVKKALGHMVGMINEQLAEIVQDIVDERKS